MVTITENLTMSRPYLLIFKKPLRIKGRVAKSVARQLATAALCVRIQTSLKNHKWAT